MTQSIDWRDILIHAAGGVAAGFLAHLIGWWPLLIISGAFWIGREAYQRVQKGQPMAHMFAVQPLLEWAAPSIAGLAVYIGLGALA